MKKVFTLLIALILGWGVKAQCPLQTAVDFTATDVHGERVHLFDILDRGQYVLLDFFFTTCGPCQQATPKIRDSYTLMGCNQHDVFYMEISDRDSDAACLNWVNNYGIEYPTISRPGGGGTICNQYQIGAFPTVVLIRPDHSIAIGDLWPINNAQTIVNALENQGVHQHACGATPEVSITIDQVLETEVTATFTPNSDCASYAYTIATDAEIQEWMGLTGLDLPNYLWTYGIPSSGTLSNTFNGLTPHTDYTIYAVPADNDGTLGEVAQETVTTTPGGGSETMPDFTGTDLDGNEIHLYDLLDAGQAVFINFFLTGDPFSETPMSDIVEAFHQYGCNNHDVFFMGISPNGHDDACQAWVEQFGVQYPIISRDGGGNDIAQAIPVALYPALMLIRPDHTFAERDIYPPTLEYIVQAMEAEGYEQASCYEETLTFGTDTLWISQMQDATPLTIYNNTTEPVIHLNKITVDDDGGWYYFTYGNQQIFLDEDFDIPIAQGDNIQLDIWMNIYRKDTIYPILSFENTLETVQLVTAFDWTSGVQVTENQTMTLRPNPANDFVTLKGENLGTVRVYNTLGQMMDEFEANGNELNIHTSSYGNGIYVVKAGEQTLRFMVRH